MITKLMILKAFEAGQTYTDIQQEIRNVLLDCPKKKVILDVGDKGAFNLSKLALERLKDLGYRGNIDIIERDNTLLVQVVEELGVELASGSGTLLHIVEVPIYADYSIIYNTNGYEAVEW